MASCWLNPMKSQSEAMMGADADVPASGTLVTCILTVPGPKALVPRLL